MQTFASLLFLVSFVAFIVFVIKALRKTSPRRNIAFAFGGMVLGLILAGASSPSLPTQMATPSMPSSATADAASPQRVVAPSAASVKKDAGPDTEMLTLAAALQEDCPNDVSQTFPAYAPSKAAAKPVGKPVIEGDRVSAHVMAGGVEFTCAAMRHGQDTAAPVVTDPKRAKAVAARQARYDAAAQAAQAEQDRKEAARARCANVKLVIGSWSWDNDDDFVKAQGEVTNVSDDPLSDITASVSYYTDDDTFIKNSQALIQYNPILAGQTSPFQTIDTINPEMKHARIEFQELIGGTVESMDRKTYDATCR